MMTTRNAKEIITELRSFVQFLKSQQVINNYSYEEIDSALQELDEKFQETSSKILTENSGDGQENAPVPEDPYAEFVDLDTEAYDDFVFELAIPFSMNDKKVGSEEILFRVIELTEEVGELAGKVKRVMRDQDGIFSKSDIDSILLELGDILFFVTLIARLLGFRLVKVLVENFIKLSSRRDRGTIRGKGDYR